MCVYASFFFFFVPVCWSRACVCGWVFSLFVSLYYLFIYLLLPNSQIQWLVDIFRAKIVDISEHSVTIEVITGQLRICFCL